jgi:hypothetical protein
MLVALALAGCGGQGATSFPASPARLVTDDELSTDVALSLGLRPVGALGLTATAWPPALGPYLSKAENLGPRTGGSANLDAIAGANPDAILGPATLKKEGWGSQLSATAPAVYYAPAGAGSSWQAAVRAVAAPVGLAARANAVIAGLELRAAALRPQVRGKTIALLRIVASQTFSTVDDYDPAVKVLVRDLGLRNAHLRPPMYGNHCAPLPTPPRACSTNDLFAGVLTVVPAVNAVLLETGSVNKAAAEAFAANSYFRELAAARSGYIASAPTYEDTGPLGVAYLYSAVEKAFGLVELHGTVAGRAVELTLDSAAHRLCWAGLPPGGAAFSATGIAHLKLPTAVGCARVAALASPASARLGGATLEQGAPSVIR